MKFKYLYFLFFWWHWTSILIDDPPIWIAESQNLTCIASLINFSYPVGTGFLYIPLTSGIYILNLILDNHIDMPVGAFVFY